MKPKYRLLEHPFYQAWNEGNISIEQLSKYGASYAEFIERIPGYWQKIAQAFAEQQTVADEIIAEETDHIPLWNKWTDKLEKQDDFPRMTKIFEAFENMTASELLGAIHAFEIQQPEVAETKKCGLLDHYGFENSDLTYFDEHMQEEKHIAYGRHLAEKFARKSEFNAGFEKGSKLIYDGLNLFMN